MFNGNRLDWCMTWSEDCGKPVADAYCQAQGFARATLFAPDPHIGARSPTRLIGTGATCDLAHCDGFQQITCLKRTVVATPQKAKTDRSRLAGPVSPRFRLYPGTRLASAGPLIIVPPIPTPRPALVSISARQTSIQEAAAEERISEEKLEDSPSPAATEKSAAVEPTPDTAAPAEQVASAKADEPKPAKEAKIFDKPMYNGKRLAWCHQFDADCGRPAADAFCKANGFSSASEFSLDPHIGDVQPTRSMGSGAVCDQAPCDGFKVIACSM